MNAADFGSEKAMRIASVVASMALVATLLASGKLHADGGDSSAKVTTLMRQPLPEHPGKDGVLVMVEYAPGHVDAAHRHPGHAFVYVLEGSVEMQVEGGELHTLKPGDTFYENPKDTHGVGRNVSKTKPAKLLVFFVKDQNAPLVLAPKR
jgi:quercetin dioxygenase-like cupin family protein